MLNESLLSVLHKGFFSIDAFLVRKAMSNKQEHPPCEFQYEGPPYSFIGTRNVEKGTTISNWFGATRSTPTGVAPPGRPPADLPERDMFHHPTELIIVISIRARSLSYPYTACSDEYASGDECPSTVVMFYKTRCLTPTAPEGGSQDDPHNVYMIQIFAVWHPP
jgi:hypothetical protein